MPKILILWLASGVTPNLRHDSNTGTVTITSSVSVTNDTAWHTLVATWRPRRLELYLDGISRANSTAANTNTSDAFGIYRRGWGFSTNQDYKWRHRPDPVLRRLLDRPHGPPLARRPLRLPTPLGRGARAHGQCATRRAPLERHGHGHLPHGVGFWTARISSCRGSAGMIDWIKVAQGGRLSSPRSCRRWSPAATSACRASCPGVRCLPGIPRLPPGALARH